ncbi:MAG: helix-turn-helix transcriptional regulator [Oscillospiraceae bacterium]|nr:helix-turn-helix transcriptional regulator [Oscillospiraceae bacterium]
MSIGKKLKSLREKSKKTLREMSEILDVSLNTVYRWEHDLAMPRKSMLKKLASFHETSLEEIMQGRDPEDGVSGYAGAVQPEVTTSDYERLIEQEMLSMFRKLRECKKHRVMGYVERLYVESLDSKSY